jgi:hypothetical protein
VIEGEQVSWTRDEVEDMKTALVQLTPDDLAEMRSALAAPFLRRAVEALDERVITSPYPLLVTFKAVVSALRSRLHHGPNPASPIVEDYPSGAIRIPAGFPSLARLPAAPDHTARSLLPP